MTKLSHSRQGFRELVDGPEQVVVRVDSPLDVSLDPLAAYGALAADGEYGFLLESAEKTAASDPEGAFEPAHAASDRHARYSFIGYDPEAVITLDPDGDSVTRCRDTDDPAAISAGEETLLAGTAGDGAEADAGDVLDRLRDGIPAVERRGFPETERQLLDGGLVGFIAYDAVYDLWLEEVGVERPESPVPDAEFVLTTRTLVFDHLEGSVDLVFTPVVDPDDDPDVVYDALEAETDRVRRRLDSATSPDLSPIHLESRSSGSRETYEAAVSRAKQAIHEGEVYQAVLSRVREMDGTVDPMALYAALREANPSPYMYLLAHEDHSIVGSSPETLCSVAGQQVLNNPIAGTCPRGESPVEDRRLAGEMLADEKERAEHTMLVDLSRNDVRRVSEPGSVAVPEFMNVLKYSHVQHIESTVTGQLRDDRDAFDAIRASFPAGTLSGAPKVRAMEYIDDLETEPRGVYGGGVGYVSWTGDAEFAIVIRTATIRHGDTDRVRVRAGAGVVADSDPAAEYEETEAKMDGVLAALHAAGHERSGPEATR